MNRAKKKCLDLKQGLILRFILSPLYFFSEHLGKQLDDYIAPYKKIKVVRTKQREGLIRARLLGFSVAKGDVVTFLDSHCECAVGKKWSFYFLMYTQRL